MPRSGRINPNQTVAQKIGKMSVVYAIIQLSRMLMA
jgi:hypothetical protein